MRELEICIKNINKANRVEKFEKLIKVLSEQLGLTPQVFIPPLLLEKAKTRKYISKKMVNGQWVYEYPKTNNERRVNIANQTDLITGIQPLQVNSSNVVKEVNNYFTIIKQAINNGLQCKGLKNRKIGGINTKHFFRIRGKKRNVNEILKRASLLPFILPIIEKYGHISHAKPNTYGGYDYELIGRAEINGKNHAITIVLSDKGKGSDLLYISVIGIQNSMVKSMLDGGGMVHPHKGPIVAVVKPTSSSNHNLIIPYISIKSIENIPRNVELIIKNITPDNKVLKFSKALNTVAKLFQLPLAISHAEPFRYPVQQQLADKWSSFYSSLFDSLFISIAHAFDLPLPTLSKALKDDELLIWRGKFIYSPETGKPLKKKDIIRFMNALQKFFNRRTRNAAKRFVFDNVAIAKLLDLLAVNQTEPPKNLSTLRHNGKSFDDISEDSKSIETNLNTKIINEERAYYQASQDFIAQKITYINETTRNEIQNIISYGIKERWSKQQVSQALFSKLGYLNRDWSRIANTEMVNIQNVSQIFALKYKLPQGEKLYIERREMINDGACPECCEVHGKIALWSAEPLEDFKGDGIAETAIWIGKPYKKGDLVYGTLHPNCRGFWIQHKPSEVVEKKGSVNKSRLRIKLINGRKQIILMKGIGDFEESEHPRDKKGQFIKKPTNETDNQSNEIVNGDSAQFPNLGGSSNYPTIDKHNVKYIKAFEEFKSNIVKIFRMEAVNKRVEERMRQESKQYESKIDKERRREKIEEEEIEKEKADFVSDNVEGLNIEAMNNVMKTIIDFTASFLPKGSSLLKNILGRIDITRFEPGKKPLMDCRPDDYEETLKGILGFGKEFFNKQTLEYVEATVTECTEGSLTSPLSEKETLIALAKHEAVHLLELILVALKNYTVDEQMRVWNDHEIAENILLRAYKIKDIDPNTKTSEMEEKLKNIEEEIENMQFKKREELKGKVKEFLGKISDYAKEEDFGEGLAETVVFNKYKDILTHKGKLSKEEYKQLVDFAGIVVELLKDELERRS